VARPGGRSVSCRTLLGDATDWLAEASRTATTSSSTLVEHLLELRTWVRSNLRANVYHGPPTKIESLRRVVEQVFDLARVEG
jgi:hypothetical protein